MPSDTFTSFLQATKLSLMLLLLFLFLPFFFFSLIFLSFISTILFLPIICILLSTCLMSAIIHQILVPSQWRGFSNYNHHWPIDVPKDNPTVENMPPRVELDPSEVPFLDHSQPSPTDIEKDDSTVENTPVSVKVDPSEVPSFNELDSEDDQEEVISTNMEEEQESENCVITSYSEETCKGNFEIQNLKAARSNIDERVGCVSLMGFHLAVASHDHCRICCHIGITASEMLMWGPVF